MARSHRKTNGHRSCAQKSLFNALLRHTKVSLCHAGSNIIRLGLIDARVHFGAQSFSFQRGLRVSMRGGNPR
jgi:hypothetical protein